MPHGQGSRLARFKHDAGGNVLVMFAVAAVATLGCVGAAVDYSRATNFRMHLHRAADAAALAAAKERNGSLKEKQALGRKVFDATVGDTTGLENIAFDLVEVNGGVRVDASADSVNRIVQVLGLKKTAIATTAEALSATNPTEVALVLDNTGSMKNDMATLRKAAKDFAETLFKTTGADQLKMAVVPYVAAVNVGAANMQMSWMDTGANARWHAQHLKNRTIATLVGCNPDPDPKPVVTSTGGGGGGGGGGSSGPPPETDRPPTGKDRSAFFMSPRTLADLALELFGIKSAQAQVTPATDNPSAGTVVNPGTTAQGNAYGGSGTVPTGFQYYHPCWLGNPSRISHFDLFNRVQGATWKGCVEARPEPYDVTDEPPSSGSPDTLFVPYFWPDEPGKSGGAGYSNSYMEDGPSPQGWTYYNDHPGTSRPDEWKAFPNLFKYTLGNKAKLQENGPQTSGPNASCPDEIQPLTGDRPTILKKIEKLKHWEGGGTISSEGLMWGWRVLSPGAPFTEGAPYDKAKKYVVLMTDGLNSFVENNAGGPTKSDYTAYGYLRDGRLPSDWFSKGETYLNDRMRLACQNVKRTGVKVMTVLFRETDLSTQALLKECASDGAFFYQAANENELRRAFTEIAGEISRLRLSR